MSHLTDPTEPIHPVITATWPVSGRFELSLWLVAAAAAGCGQPAHLDGPLTDLAVTNLCLWPTHARA
jgi:hypothetical protein